MTNDITVILTSEGIGNREYHRSMVLNGLCRNLSCGCREQISPFTYIPYARELCAKCQNGNYARFMEGYPYEDAEPPQPLQIDA